MARGRGGGPVNSGVGRFSLYLMLVSAQRQIALGIPLNVWQDPQGNVALRYDRGQCFVYFACWAEAGVPADYLCQLTFHHAWAVRGLRLEMLPYETKEPFYQSSIFVVEDSRWLREVSDQRLKNYPNWKTWDTRDYLHYVVQGHDNYYDIIASGFDETKLSETDAGDLAHLIAEA